VAWLVKVAEHEVERWHIAGQVLKVWAVDARAARVYATRHVHVIEALPPWKPLLRMTYSHTTAERLGG